MSRHSQKPSKSHMTCPNCHKGFCKACVDVARILAGYQNTICQCTRKGHSGEPNEKQILDPESGSVFTPGLEITRDGKVKRL